MEEKAPSGMMRGSWPLRTAQWACEEGASRHDPPVMVVSHPAAPVEAIRAVRVLAQEKPGVRVLLGVGLESERPLQHAYVQPKAPRGPFAPTAQQLAIKVSAPRPWTIHPSTFSTPRTHMYKDPHAARASR
jgi:hypothetical protein